MTNKMVINNTLINPSTLSASHFNIQKLNQHKQIALKNYLLQNLEENTPIDFLLLSETRIDEQEYIPNWVKHDPDLNSQYVVFTDHKNQIENFSHSKGTARLDTTRKHSHFREDSRV